MNKLIFLAVLSFITINNCPILKINFINSTKIPDKYLRIKIINHQSKVGYHAFDSYKNYEIDPSKIFAFYIETKENKFRLFTNSTPNIDFSEIRSESIILLTRKMSSSELSKHTQDSVTKEYQSKLFLEICVTVLELSGKSKK